MIRPKVSICIPTYNGREYLAECIASAQSQTFQDWEALICDDKSSDGTIDIARKLVADDPRFRVISNARRFGLVGNWNNCIREARGDWIKFLFQDDLLRPSCIQTLYDACQQSGQKFAFCDRDFLFDRECSEQLRDSFFYHKRRLRSDYESSPLIPAKRVAVISSRECTRNLVGEPTVTLIHKSIFCEIGYFDEGLIQLCDAEMWCRIMLNYGGIFVPRDLATFRVHAKATTATNHSKRAFRANVLDRLVIQYLFAFGRHFRLIRDSNVTNLTGLTLRRQCANSAHSAWTHARDVSQSGDHSLLAEWREMRASCPGIQVLAMIGSALSFCAGIKKRIGRFFIGC